MLGKNNDFNVFRIEEEFAVFDIGERTIKCLLFRIGENLDYIYTNEIESQGIENGNIINLISLSNAIFQLIYNVEVDVGTIVKNVIISFSFPKFEHKKFQENININGIIKKSHIQNLNYRLKFDVNDTIIGYLYKDYQIDKMDKIENPEQMCGSNLTLKANFITISNNTIRNLATIFNRNSISINFVALNGLISHFDILEDNFIMVEVGNKSTRVFTKFNSENFYDFYTIEVGFFHLLKELNSIDSNVEKIQISYNSESKKEKVDISREFFRNLFSIILQKTKANRIFNIYLSGSICTVPLIDLFLKQKFDINFIIPNTPEIPCSANPNIFRNCFSIAKYLFKDLDKLQNNTGIHRYLYKF